MSLLPRDEEDKEQIITFDNILELIHSRNISVIVEGVETIEQVKLLDKRDLTGYQGYYFSRPISYDLFIEYLNNKKLGK